MDAVEGSRANLHLRTGETYETANCWRTVWHPDPALPLLSRFVGCAHGRGHLNTSRRNPGFTLVIVRLSMFSNPANHADGPSRLDTLCVGVGRRSRHVPTQLCLNLPSCGTRTNIAKRFVEWRNRSDDMHRARGLLVLCGDHLDHSWLR